MKKVSKLAVILGLGTLLGSSGLFADTSFESSYVKSYQGRTDIPVPLEVVSPESAAGLTGQVEVQFVVSKTGAPTQIIVRSTTDDALVESVVAAVSKWKFAPALINGEPVAKKVVLPVHFKTASGGLFASY